MIIRHCIADALLYCLRDRNGGSASEVWGSSLCAVRSALGPDIPHEILCGLSWTTSGSAADRVRGHDPNRAERRLFSPSWPVLAGGGGAQIIYSAAAGGQPCPFTGLHGQAGIG